MEWLLCLLSLHDWDKWTEVRRGNIADYKGSVIGNYLEQQRQCKNCGKIKLHKQRV